MVFKAYDIRGEYSSEVNEELFSSIAKAVHVLGPIKKVVVGCDMRSSSPSLKQAFIEGLLESGIDVIDIDLASTPMVYQITGEIDVDLGVIITASHNPGKDNGMKLCRANAVPIAWDTGISDLKQAVENKNFILSEVEGRYEKYDYKKEYISKISSFAKPKRELRVVLDTGNGMGGLVDIDILTQFCEIIPLFRELDGSFPNHEANPIVEETLKDLKSKVIREDADVGFAMDGDADRLGVVDENGNFIPADILACFLIDYFVKEHPEENVYSFDLRSSKIVEQIISSHDKLPVKTRVGHSFIKTTMREKKSFFSSELSGHYYFWFSSDLVYDSAVRAAIEVIGVLSSLDMTLSEAVAKYRTYIKSEEKNFAFSSKSQVIDAIKQEFSDGEFEEIDGISVNYDNWWFNVRFSNTENKLRLNLEANTQDIFDEKIKVLTGFLNQFS